MTDNTKTLEIRYRVFEDKVIDYDYYKEDDLFMVKGDVLEVRSQQGRTPLGIYPLDKLISAKIIPTKDKFGDKS